ncbi:MAG: hypothetical protein ACYCZN_05000 [Candidatus Dormibacteria bacterium]
MTASPQLVDDQARRHDGRFGQEAGAVVKGRRLVTLGTMTGLLAMAVVSASVSVAPWSTSPLGPPFAQGSNRAASRTLASQLLSSVPLPPRTSALARTPNRTLAVPQEGVGSGDLIDDARFFQVGLPVSTFNAFASTHRPAATGVVETGMGGAPGIPTVLSMTFAMARLPAFAAVAQVVYSFTAGQAGTTLLRVDAQVVWRPARSSDTLIPVSDALATVTLSSFGGRGLRRRQVTIGPGVGLAELVRDVNAEPTFPPGLVGCTAVDQEVTAKFFATPDSLSPNATLQIEVGCAAYRITTHLGAVELVSAPTVHYLLSLFSKKQPAEVVPRPSG